MKDVFTQAEKGYGQWVRKQYMMISQQRMGRLKKQEDVIYIYTRIYLLTLMYNQ